VDEDADLVIVEPARVGPLAQVVGLLRKWLPFQLRPDVACLSHEDSLPPRLADEEALTMMVKAVEKTGQPNGVPVIIRPETPSDHGSIRDILIAAFANHPYSHQTEHLIVEALRADDALAVSLVAEVDGDVVGHIAFSPVTIDGKDCGWFALGPVAVLPAFQRQGIGQALINEGLKVIRNLGAQGCALVGDPAYYRRFGFGHNPALRMEGIPPEVLLCLPIGGRVPEGSVTHHPAFSVGL
jgi:putative acetyltransferase